MTARKIGKVLGNIFTTICLVFIVWVVISYFEVISKNLNPNPEYWALNFFELFFGGK